MNNHIIHIRAYILHIDREILRPEIRLLAPQIRDQLDIKVAAGLGGKRDAGSYILGHKVDTFNKTVELEVLMNGMPKDLIVHLDTIVGVYVDSNKLLEDYETLDRKYEMIDGKKILKEN